jgi:glycosyltransferase involved in cell wall biosynthesis
LSAAPSPIRLLAVTHSLSGGGAERFVSVLASRLDRARFLPAVALAVDRRGYEVPADIELFPLGYQGVLSLPASVRRLRRVIAEWRPDVILSNVLSTNCLTGAALARAAGSGVGPAPAWVARIGNAPELSEPWPQRLWARRCYPRAAILVSNSQRMREAVARAYPALAGRCRALGNPTDFEAIDRRAAASSAVEPATGGSGRVRDRGSGSGSVTVLWLGRLTRQKRPELALQAVARARQRLTAEAIDLRLVLCGEGPLRTAVEHQVARLGLTGVVELAGFCDNPFVRMREADCLLMTSDHEGLPNALIEAQGLGLPAVATACPYGPDEILADGETGRLVPVGDAAAAAEALIELASQPELAQRWGEAARHRARRLYGLDHLLPRWQELLIEAAGTVAPNHPPTAHPPTTGGS